MELGNFYRDVHRDNGVDLMLESEAVRIEGAGTVERVATADGRTLVVPFGPLDPALAADARATGAHLLEPEAEPLASLVLCHRLAVALAAARGLDPDTPRNLTRSVVLT